MNEYRKMLYDYITEHYDDVVVQAQGGPYIAIDLIPGCEKELPTMDDIEDSCAERGISLCMITVTGYCDGSGDGLRENRYWYFMQKSTAKIFRDMKIDIVLEDEDED